MSEQRNDKDTSVIPYGYYCYEVIGHKTREDGMPVTVVKPCPYMSNKEIDRGELENWCNYLDTTDECIYDSCKSCGINEPPEDEDEDETNKK